MDSAPPTAATDQPADDAAPARQCARPGCSNPAPKGPTGRPKQYCSRSCRSKNDRAKAKAREAAAEAAAPPAAPDAAPGPAAVPLDAAPAVPDPGAAPDHAAPAAAVQAGDDRWGEDGQHLLGLADALRRKLTWFLEETETGDPVAAFMELALRLPGYSHRVYSAAQEIRDKTRWPDLTERERVNRRMRERIDIWDNDTAPADADQDDGSAPRGETPTDGDDQEQPAAAVPATADLAPPAGPVALEEGLIDADAAPVLRRPAGASCEASSLTPCQAPCGAPTRVSCEHLMIRRGTVSPPGQSLCGAVRTPPGEQLPATGPPPDSLNRREQSVVHPARCRPPNAPQAAHSRPGRPRTPPRTHPPARTPSGPPSKPSTPSPRCATSAPRPPSSSPRSTSPKPSSTGPAKTRSSWRPPRAWPPSSRSTSPPPVRPRPHHRPPGCALSRPRRPAGPAPWRAESQRAEARLELSASRSRPAPADRDLGRAILDSPLVRGAIWLRWTGDESVRTLHHGAGLARGWMEKDVDGLNGWVAVVEGRIVVGTGPDGQPQPLVHAETWQAGSTLHAALAQHPADDDQADDIDPGGREHELLGDVRRRVRSQASGMTLESTEQALEQARFEERRADRHTDAGHESAAATAADALAEWQRLHDHITSTGAQRYDQDHDVDLQQALRAARHCRDIADRAREATHQAHRTTDVAHRRLAGTAAQPLYTALERAGLHHLTEDDHQAVRELTNALDPATLRQVMGWLERTRAGAIALRGAAPAPAVRPVVRRSRY
ncbi:hypothetical protein ACPC54_39495 [Kitasatospora sp. NPDC094028]